MRASIISFSLLVTLGSVAHAQTTLPPTLREVGFDQRLNEQVPLDLVFRDEADRSVRLGDLIHDKPVILVLAYFKCPMLCTQVLNGTVRVLLDMPLEIGKDFTVLTVSFDPRETPELAAAKKKTYLERLRRPEAEENWHFLTGEEESIERLTAAVGFRYVYDARNDQFAHASGIVVLTPEGKISRYLFGINFSPSDLRLSLVEASANRTGSPIERILFYCFHYDPNEGKYGSIVMAFVRVGGVLTILGIGTLFAVLWRRERRDRRRDATTAR